MSSVLAEAIEVTDAFPEGVDYKFPRRNLGRGRLLVWLTTCAVLGVVYWMLAGPIARLVLNGLTLGNILSVALWSYLSFLSLRYPLWFCLGLLFGHREVGLQVDSLCTGERIGLLRRNKRCPLERLRRLQIADLLPVVPHEDSGLGPVGGLLHVLTGVLDDGKRIVIAPGYPRSVLDPFVEELSKRISLAPRESGIAAAGSIDEQALAEHNQRRPIAPGNPQMLEDGDAEALATQPPSSRAKGRVEAAPSIGIPDLIAEVAEAVRKAAEPDVYDQPPGSDVQVEWFPDGITMRVPPAGIWKGGAGYLLRFGIMWCVATAGFSVLFLVAEIAQGEGVSGVLGLLTFMGFFWLAGAGLLLAGWNMGTREAAVTVVADSLMVIQTGLRRAKRREWPRSEITTVRVGWSDMEANDRVVVELQIHGTKGKLFGMLAGRDERELIWMAMLLREALKSTPPTDAAEEVVAS